MNMSQDNEEVLDDITFPVLGKKDTREVFLYTYSQAEVEYTKESIADSVLIAVLDMQVEMV